MRRENDLPLCGVSVCHATVIAFALDEDLAVVHASNTEAANFGVAASCSTRYRTRGRDEDARIGWVDAGKSGTCGDIRSVSMSKKLGRERAIGSTAHHLPANPLT